MLLKKTRTRSILRRTPKSRQYLVKLPLEVAESKKSPLNRDRCSTVEAS